MKRDFLAITDFSREEILATLKLAKELKDKQAKGEAHTYLAGKAMAMIFQKPSARTRVSFEVGMFQLGGHALNLGPELGMGERESVPDVGQVMSRFVDLIMARLFGHEDIEGLAENASVPVINGLTDLLHPCQVVADLQTVIERFGQRDDLKITWVGDGNNVANSWINMASRYPMHLCLAVPEGYEPDTLTLTRAQQAGLSEIEVVNDAAGAAQDAAVIYTDVWASMGQEEEAAARRKAFKDFQVNDRLMSFAGPDCIFMHCLPAHRGDEVTESVIDGPQSVVFDEAENRLHAQKAIMVKLFE